jgi:BirA family transcriptional regulator, biotin operon repressor / biotin---[acetyl-CoA-carboxylase] ligase
MSGFQPRLPAGYRLVCFDSVGSTNDQAKSLARGGAPADTVIWAREQTAGRGRRGHVWSSPPGNLYVSLILRPDCPVNRAVQLGFVAALAVGEALRTILPALEKTAYKWPNDVLVNGRKLAGILLESELTTPDRPDFVVLGVGVNLLTSPHEAEFPATSVADEGLAAPSPLTMLEGFAEQFRCWYRRWQEDGFAPVRTAWLAGAAVSGGKPIRVRLEAVTLQGRFRDIDHEGNLLLDCAGRCRRIAAGEVFPAA